MDAETGGPAPVGLCRWGVSGLGFLSVQGGELLLTNSFVSKVPVKFIKSMWAQTQEPQTNNHPVPSSHTSGQSWMVHSPSVTSPP